MPPCAQDFARLEGIPVDTALRCARPRPAAPACPAEPRALLRRVYRRYLKLEPGHAEEYIEFLKSRELWNEAALRLADVVNNDLFVVCAPVALAR